MRPQEIAKYSLEKDSKKSFDGSIFIFFGGSVIIRVADTDAITPFIFYPVHEFNLLLQIFDYIRCYGLYYSTVFKDRTRDIEIGNSHKISPFKRIISYLSFYCNNIIKLSCSRLEFYSNELIFYKKKIKMGILSRQQLLIL